MKKVVVFSALLCSFSFGHFQALLLSEDVVESAKKIEIKYEFTHPFEQSNMEMVEPKEVGVYIDGKKEDMKKLLKSAKCGDKSCFSATFPLKQPSVHIFYVDPAPYFEIAEEKFIRHITKSTLEVAGANEGWDATLGLKAEIIPLTRPYGLYSGNIFQGVVMFNGKRVADVAVEVELYNDQGFKAPTEAHITQVIKTDSNGVFSFVMPKAGYWGFSALLEDDKPLKHIDGKEYPIEIGAVFWVKVYDYEK